MPPDRRPLPPRPTITGSPDPSPCSPSWHPPPPDRTPPSSSSLARRARPPLLFLSPRAPALEPQSKELQHRSTQSRPPNRPSLPRSHYTVSLVRSDNRSRHRAHQARPIRCSRGLFRPLTIGSRPRRASIVLPLSGKFAVPHSCLCRRPRSTLPPEPPPVAVPPCAHQVR
jgi:hypothetical protein